MREQPEALRLADELMECHNGHVDEGPSSFSEAAAELRRLHAEVERLGAPSAEPSVRVQGKADSAALHHPARRFRETMQDAMDALINAQPYVADYCKESIVMAHNEAITALRAALGEGNE